MVEKAMSQRQLSRLVALIGVVLSVILLLALVQALAAQETAEELLTPNLQVSKTVDPTQVSPGELVHYTIVLDNDGTSPATGVELTDMVPADLHSISNVMVVGGGNYGLNGNVITWTGAVNNGAQVTLDFDAVLTDTAVASTLITNTAEVTGTGELLTADAVFTVSTADPAELNVTKSVNHAVTYPGDTLDYTIVINNSGGSTATDVSLHDALPADLTYQAGSLEVSGGGSYGVAGNVITWTGDITDGAAIHVLFTGLVAQTVTKGDIIENLVTVTDGGNVVTDTAVSSVQTTFGIFLPIINKTVPAPVLNPIGIPTSNNDFQTFLFTLSWNDVASGATYVVQEARQPDFADAVEYNVGNVTTYVIEHSGSTDARPYYYRVQANAGSGASEWSNTSSQFGIYYDSFDNNTSGWSIRREDTDDVNNDTYYQNGNFVVKIRGRWDYAIASPVVAIPWSSYSLRTRVRFDPTVDNLHGMGIIFGADKIGDPCPNSDYSSCFNHYYRLVAVWYGATNYKVQLKRIDYHEPDTNVGRGDALYGFTDWNVSNSNDWHEWRIEVRSNGQIQIFIDTFHVTTVYDTSFVGANTYFGVFASTDEYSGAEPWFDWFRVTPLP